MESGDYPEAVGLKFLISLHVTLKESKVGSLYDHSKETMMSTVRESTCLLGV